MTPSHIATRPGRSVAVAALMVCTGLLAGTASAQEVAPGAADLTIELDGDLLRHGGVVTVYAIPTPAPLWAEVAAGGAARTIRLDQRYAEVQLRFPVGGKYAYRFRPAEGQAPGVPHRTQVLSVIGTDMEGRGPRMKSGFVDADSDGGRVIRVPPLTEIAGDSAARWGRTEGRDAVPPADSRSARVLAGLIRQDSDAPKLACEGSGPVRACTLPRGDWPALELLWWRGIAESRLERLDHYALRRCYDSVWFREGRCEPEADSDEPAYRHVPK
jgi:hypothetical protein